MCSIKGFQSGICLIGLVVAVSILAIGVRLLTTDSIFSGYCQLNCSKHKIGYTWWPVLMMEKELRKPWKKPRPREATGKFSHIPSASVKANKEKKHNKLKRLPKSVYRVCVRGRIIFAWQDDKVDNILC